jgi:hypothetical protein
LIAAIPPKTFEGPRTMASKSNKSTHDPSSSSPLSFKMKVTRSGGACSKTGGGSGDPYSPGNGESDNEIDPNAFSDGEGDGVPAATAVSSAPPRPVVTTAPSPVGCAPFEKAGSPREEDFDEIDSAIGCFGQISKRQSSSTAKLESSSNSSSSKLTKSMTLASEQPQDETQAPTANHLASVEIDKSACANKTEKDLSVASDDGDMLVQASLRALNEKTSENISVKTESGQVQKSSSVAKSSSEQSTKVVEVSLRVKCSVIKVLKLKLNPI